MRNECIQAVAQAIGRSIIQVEAQGIEARILDQMKQLARKDPAAWQQMSREARLRAAAAEAGKSTLATASKQKQRVALTIIAHDRVMNRYAALRGEFYPPTAKTAAALCPAIR